MKVIYFELNNWSYGEDFPAVEPFISWMGLLPILRHDGFAKENKLCIVASNVDMSQNFCISASEEWVKDHCPELLTKYTQFLREPDEDGEVYGRFGCPFAEYEESNFGVTWWSDEDDD